MMHPSRRYAVLLVALLLLAGFGLWVGQVASAERDPVQSKTAGIAAQAPSTLEVVGHLGGDATVVAISGTHAYVGFGPKLVVMDISDPNSLTPLNTHIFGGRVRDIELMGPYAYIAASDAGLRVMDISDSEALREVGSYESTGLMALTRSGNYLYVAWQGLTQLPRIGSIQDSQVIVLDISSPTRPAKIGASEAFLGLYNQPVDLTIAGTYLYVTSATRPLPMPFVGGALVVLDIANPSEPRFMNRLGVDGGSFTVAGGYGYLAGVSGLHRMDLSNPITPTIIATYPVASEQVEIVDGVAYVAAGTNGLRLVDISNPTTFHEIGSYQASDITGFDVAVRGESNRLYLAGGPAGLRLFDIANPATPTELAAYDPPRVGHAKEVVVAGNYAYLIASYASSLPGGDDGLFVVDVSNPMIPVVAGILGIPQEISQLEVQGSYLYLMGRSGLRIIDVSQPTTPTEVGLYQPPALSESTGAYGLEVVGDHAYLAYGEWLRIVDVSNPTAPREIKSVVLGGNVTGVVVEGAYAYLSGSSLRILDISNPQAPVVVGSSEEGAYASMVVSQGYLHAIYNTLGVGGNIIFHISELFATDVSDPAQPVTYPHAYFMDATDWMSEGNEIDVVGNQLYVAHSERLYVLDKTDPTRPSLVVSHESAGSPQSVAVARGLIFVADLQGGLLILRQQGSVEGQVRQANGLPFAGATLSLGTTMSTQSDATGSYTFTQVLPGTYTLTPTLSGYRFWPPTRTVTVPSTQPQDFTILPLPVSGTLGSDSGLTLSYTDTQGLVTALHFPAGVVTQSTTVMVTPTLAAHEPDYHFAGHAFEVEATQGGVPLATFSASVTVTIRYSEADVLVTDESDLVLWRWTAGGWQEATESCQPASSYRREVATNTLSLAICQPGRYALFGPTNRLYLPLVVSSTGATAAQSGPETPPAPRRAEYTVGDAP